MRGFKFYFKEAIRLRYLVLGFIIVALTSGIGTMLRTINFNSTYEVLIHICAIYYIGWFFGVIMSFNGLLDKLTDLIKES